MSPKTIFIIALILFFLPVILGKVDASQVWLVLKDPKQLTDTRVLKLVFGDLARDVVEYYKDFGRDLFERLLGTAKEEIEKKEVEIKIK